VSLRAASDELEKAFRAREPLVYIVTAEEERAIECVQIASARLGRSVYAWTQARGLGAIAAGRWNGTLASPTTVLESVSEQDESAAVALLDFHVALRDPAVVRRLKDTARRIEGTSRTLVIVAPELVAPPELANDLAVIDLPLPTMGELGEALEAFCTHAEKGARIPGPRSPDVRDAISSAARGLTAREFARALARSMVARGRVDEGTVGDVLEAKHQSIRKSGVLDVVAPSDGLDAVGGLDVLKRWLVQRRDGFTERARAFGLPAPRGVLLVGVQGAGKSLCARSIARAWTMPLLRLDVGAIFAGLVGSSEANVRHALGIATRMSPCVLWVDEIEKGLSARASSSDAGTAQRVFATLLTWMQERSDPVFVVATANDVDALPSEFLRKGRFDEIFFVDLPTIAERHAIASIHLARRGRDPARFDLEEIAHVSDGMSGAEIEAAVVAALYHAFEAQRELETRDVLRAIRETVPLSRTVGERLDALREWARTRARAASTPTRRVTV
jgi:SpoVK/Ycf46/Vps4 family AAA+-type ATPase